MNHHMTRIVAFGVSLTISCGLALPAADPEPLTGDELGTVKVFISLKDIEKHGLDKPLENAVKGAVGETLEVRLEDGGGQPFGWKLIDPDSKQFEKIGEKMERNPQGFPGIRECKLFTFKILAEGKLNFDRRPVGALDKPLPHPTVMVSVKHQSQ